MPRKRVSQTSLEYWKQREDEARRIYQGQEQNYDEEISRIYNRMLKDIQLQINGFFGRYASSEGITVAEAKARADAMDVADFAEKAKKYVQARDFSKEANEALKLYNLTMKVNRLELLKANIGLEMVNGFDELQKYMDGILVDRIAEECERQSGILGETVKLNGKNARSLVQASFNHATFHDRAWMYQGMLKAELATLLEQGIVQGKHANELARVLEKRFGVSKFKCQRLMRTEMARVQTEAQKISFEQAGYDEYIFIAEHDSRTCSICGWLDGRTYKLSEMMPGTNAAPVHPMCRCSTAAYMDRRQFEKMVAKSKADDTLYEGAPKSWEKLKGENLGNIKDINPKYKHHVSISASAEDIGYTTNCVNCVIAYDLREKGWNVIAKSSAMCNVIRKAKKCWEGVDPITIKKDAFVEFTEKMKKWGPNARAFVGTKNNLDSKGHAIVAEFREGNLVLLDPQKNLIYSEINDIKQIITSIDEYWRIDNLEVTDTGYNACQRG